VSDAVKQIVIAQAGMCFVGDAEREGDHVVLRNAFNVWRWGTERGLGELAAMGPRPNTVLHACSVVRMHELAVVASIPCDAAAWESGPALSVPSHVSKRIVIGLNRWVWLGDVTRNGDHLIVTKANVVRKAGTTKWFGELAIQGPRPTTKLDQVPSVRVHILGVVAQIDCNANSWPATAQPERAA
jgi:hypothetical protein